MRKLAAFAAAFSAAVFAWRYGLWPAAALGALACVVALFFTRRIGDPARRRTGRLGLSLILAGVILALNWCALFSAYTLLPWEGRHQEKDALLEARIDGRPALDDRGRLVVEAQFTDPDTGRKVDGVLYLPPGSEARPGDRLTLRGTIYLADRIGQDQVTYYTAKGTFLRVYASQVVDRERPEQVSLRYWPLLAMEGVEAELHRLFGPETGPLAVALVTGNKAGLEDAFLAMSRRAGLSHVMAISGMHVSFLAGLMAVFLGRRKKSSVVLTLLILIFFALMAGGTPSVWRAVILCGAGLLAPLAGRENDPPTSLLTALMLLLIANPYAAASISLQLSFAAVAGMEVLSPVLLKKWMPKREKKENCPRFLWRKCREILAAGTAVSLGAILFTTPLTAWYFGTVSLIGPVSNLLALWAVSGAFLLSVLAAAAGFVLPVLGRGLAWVGSWPLRYLLWLTSLLGKLPFAAVTMNSFYYAAGLLTLYMILCLNLFWPSKGKKRLRVPAACSLALVVVCVAFTRLEFTLGDLTVAVLDVGQGQSVCVYAGGRTVLIDCGGTGYTDPGDVAADYLADLGTDRLDLLVLTHYHADHANGVPELMSRMEVAEVALPDVDPEDELRRAVLAGAEREGAAVTYITSDTVYPLGENAVLKLYAPLGDGGANERGLSALITAGDYDVLITGDMNAQVEERLVKYGGLPDIELLVVGHHGSRYSTGEILLDATAPEVAVISVGKNNSYGHPAQETLDRLAEDGITIYRTDLSGTVVIHTNAR